MSSDVRRDQEPPGEGCTADAGVGVCACCTHASAKPPCLAPVHGSGATCRSSPPLRLPMAAAVLGWGWRLLCGHTGCFYKVLSAGKKQTARRGRAAAGLQGVGGDAFAPGFTQLQPHAFPRLPPKSHPAHLKADTGGSLCPTWNRTWGDALRGSPGGGIAQNMTMPKSCKKQHGLGRHPTSGITYAHIAVPLCGEMNPWG